MLQLRLVAAGDSACTTALLISEDGPTCLPFVEGSGAAHARRPLPPARSETWLSDRKLRKATSLKDVGVGNAD